MSNKTINSEQGHWLLAKMGKRVLRPGGKELTLKLVNELDIGHKDAVVEFAPVWDLPLHYCWRKTSKLYRH